MKTAICTDDKITTGTVLINEKSKKFVVLSTDFYCGGNVREFILARARENQILNFVGIKRIYDGDISKFKILKY